MSAHPGSRPRRAASTVTGPPRTRVAGSPIYSVCSILIAIRSLLTDPNCASPANPEAAHLYQTDKKVGPTLCTSLAARAAAALPSQPAQLHTRAGR